MSISFLSVTLTEAGTSLVARGDLVPVTEIFSVSLDVSSDTDSSAKPFKVGATNMAAVAGANNSFWKIFTLASHNKIFTPFL